MKVRRAILWFRQDLRVHDNEALQEALKNADEIIPVYVFDERVFLNKTPYGNPKTGRYRCKFILESIHDLRDQLRSLGSELIVRIGKPEEILFEIASAAKSSWVFCNRERTSEEVAVQDALEKNLWTIGQEVRFSRGKMLYYTQDLPFPVTHCPDIFTFFRKEVEKMVDIREPLPTPHTLPAYTFAINPGDIPLLADFGHSEIPDEPRAVMHFRGGEREALKRLHYYLWETDLIKYYEDTRNGMIGGDYSSKFSPWLAQGCLSPKLIYSEIKRYESERGANKSTYWLFFELLWRDFFRLMAKKHGNKIFQKGGLIGESNANWKNDETLYQKWQDGKTGVPFVDAHMRELKHTGFMSNRGRQNVASFLVKDLQVNWQMGADYFESMLIDYDVASNWGNWNYIAGVGSDPREDRYFNILSQAMKYDPKGEFVKRWVPELAGVSIEKIHRVDLLTNEEVRALDVNLEDPYPQPLVNIGKWA